MRRREQGVSLALFLVTFALVMVALLATSSLSRLAGSRDDRETTRARLEAAAAALEHFVATFERLPCPANPQLSSAAETGLEERNADQKRCTHGEGTLPWKTIGMRRDDAYDAWGRRISYRVYTGNAGTGKDSLAQAYGASMVQCDTVEPTTGNTNSDGICVRNDDPQQRSTRRSKYLEVNRLALDDMSTLLSDVAFVVMSHGSSGRGAYTSSGARIEMPSGVELANTRAAGPFTIQAFSDAETSPKSGSYFDDLLVFRRLEDMLKRGGLLARNWPEIGVPAGSIRFDLETVSAAGGANVSGTDTGSAILDFGDAYVVGVAGNSATNIAIGTAGTADGIGVIAGSNPKMSYSEGEWLYVLFDATQSRFGMTLADFGTYASGALTYTETVLLAFYRDGNLVAGPVLKSACRADGGLASFDHNVGVNYDAALIFPYQATASSGSPGDSAFLLSEVRTCPGSATDCKTGLWAATNSCP